MKFKINTFTNTASSGLQSLSGFGRSFLVDFCLLGLALILYSHEQN